MPQRQAELQGVSDVVCILSTQYATHCVAMVQVGKKNRSVGATLMNQDSSRSHSIFTITVEKLQQGDGQVYILLSP